MYAIKFGFTYFVFFIVVIGLQLFPDVDLLFVKALSDKDELDNEEKDLAA